MRNENDIVARLITRVRNWDLTVSEASKVLAQAVKADTAPVYYESGVYYDALAAFQELVYDRDILDDTTFWDGTTGMITGTQYRGNFYPDDIYLMNFGRYLYNIDYEMRCLKKDIRKGHLR